MLPWLLSLALLMIVVALWVKTRLLRRAFDEIAEGLEERLGEDTNTLLSLSTQDPHARGLASALNRQLRLLRAERRRYQNGDRELRETVAGVSHDLRTPLTAILGYLELLEREELSDNARRYAAVIAARAAFMRDLTDELFTYSLARSPDRPQEAAAVTVNAVLEESLAAFYTQLTARGITPEVSMPDTPVIRNTDPAALGRIFQNLLSNAVKYSQGDLELVLSPAGAVTFSNRAPAMTELELSRLFDRFTTVRTARRSTGLCLATTKALCGSIGAALDAKYEEGRLSVTVTMPPP